MTPVWKVAKGLHLLLYKIRQVEVVEEGNCAETHFCALFLQAVHDGVRDPNYLLKKHCSDWVYQMFRTILSSVIVTRHGVWIGYWICWALETHNYN
jgi:hypothetical protein